MEVTKSVVFDSTSYPPLILASCSSVQKYYPFHWYHCICSVDPCLWVLWMITHSCFAPSFPPFHSSRLSQPDIGAQEPDAIVDDDSYYTAGAYYYVQAADDDRELFRRILGRRPAPLSICIPICASHLMAPCLLYACTQILLLPLTRLCSSTCIQALEAPAL